MSRAAHQIKEKKKLYRELQVAIEIQEDCFQRKLGSIKTNKSGKIGIIQLTSDRREGGANKK